MPLFRRFPRGVRAQAGTRQDAAASGILSPDQNDDLSSLIQAWLSIQDDRAQRRFLEQHPELLDARSDAILWQALERSKGTKDWYHLNEALVLLKDIQSRARGASAIRDAYVNLRGGFALDLPQWLEASDRKDAALRRDKERAKAVRVRIKLWQSMLERIRRDAGALGPVKAQTYVRLWEALNDSESIEEGAVEKELLPYLDAALETYTQLTYPFQWAQLQYRIGLSYFKSAMGDRSENLERSIAAFQKALQVHSNEQFPYSWATDQHYLASALARRIAGDKVENQEHAITAFVCALEVFTEPDFPFEWARTQNNLGITFGERIKGNRAENQERTIGCYTAALRINTRTEYPQQWATIQNNLGAVYHDRVLGSRRANIEQAIAAFTASLQVYTRRALPFAWARGHGNLANAYQSDALPNRGDYLERAIGAYNLSLEVFTKSRFPEEWARTQHNLGEVYEKRINGDPESNFRSAVMHFELSMQVSTRGKFPLSWAQNMDSLGVAYLHRARGNPSENLALAASCFKQALMIRSQETFPLEHRESTLHLAEVEATQGNWTAAHDLYARAHDTEETLLALGAGVVEWDAILKQGGDADARDGFALTRLGRLEQAAVAIERGRARVLAEAMALDSADAARISDATLRARYIAMRTQLVEAQSALHLLPVEHIAANLELTSSYRTAKAAFDNVISEIRSRGDPSDFFNKPLDATTLVEAAATIHVGHAIVYLGATPWGGFALAVRSKSTYLNESFVWLDIPQLTDALVEELVLVNNKGTYGRTLGGFAVAQAGRGFNTIAEDWSGKTLRTKARGFDRFCRSLHVQNSLSAAFSVAFASPSFRRLAGKSLTKLTKGERGILDATVEQELMKSELKRCSQALSDTVLQPLAKWLQELDVSTCTLIPCGALGAFPLTSLPLSDGNSLLDHLPTSVAPSARSLLGDSSVRDPRSGVYALGDPNGNLHWSEIESRSVQALAEQFGFVANSRTGELASRDWLLDAISRGYAVDASCHGSFNPRDVLRSALQLAAKERLTLAELLSHLVNIRGLRLLILSACQTSILDVEGASNEVRSLAAGMLQAGARAVIAASWSVDDRATYLLIVRFMQLWLQDPVNIPPASALAEAQRWLRTRTSADLVEWEASLPGPSDIDQSEMTVRDAEVSESTRRLTSTEQLVAIRGRSSHDDVETQGDAQAIQPVVDPTSVNSRPYSDAHFWAGFQVIGW